jgi:hypothetical protein
MSADPHGAQSPMSREPDPGPGPVDPFASFAQLVVLNHDVIERELKRLNLWSKWSALDSRVSKALSEGTVALETAQKLTGKGGDHLRAFKRETVSRNLVRKTNPRAGELQVVAVQLAAALFGEEIGRWAEVASGPTERAAAEPPRPVRLAVFRARDIAYTQDIYIGFVTRLAATLGGSDRVHLVADRVTHADAPDAGDDWEQPEEVVEPGPIVSPVAADARDVVARARDHRADYLVAVGTQAAEALKGALGGEYGKGVPCPVVFLGVTDPVDCALVNTTERHSPDPLNVSGVGYGRGLNGIATWIRTHWPEAPIRFVYRTGVTQDEQAAKSLVKMSLGDFGVEKYDRFPTAHELDKLGDAILFSWHAFERMYEHPELRKVLAGRRVVATTRRNVEYGHAVVGYSADDFEIGARGAALVEKHRRVGGSLGALEVFQPHYRPWVHDGARTADWVPKTVFDEFERATGAT